ncbi:Protein NRT1/ PTR FAMILY 1.1 [Linum perenne]
MEEDNRRSLADEEDETMALTPKKGGFRTMPFIILSEALHSLANTGLNANMVIYLTKELLMEAVTASSIISLWSAASSFLSVGGAVLSDSLLGRFTVIIIGSFFTLLVRNVTTLLQFFFVVVFFLNPVDKIWYHIINARW